MTTAPVKTMTLRAGATFAATGIALGMLAACSPAEPKPTPSKTALFASEEEAFAAAEETYRAYLDALNAVDTRDTASFDAVYAWTTGEANAGARESFTELAAEEISLTGDSVIDTTTPISADSSDGSVTLHLCVDVSDTDVLDASGQSLVPDGRSAVQSLRVEFIPGATATGLTISSFTGDDKRCS